MAEKVAAGSFLFAVPQMLDPNFMHSVVLLVEHGPAGAYGLVTNRPLDATVDQLLPDRERLHGHPFPLHSGGPVGEDTLQFLHTVPDAIPGGVEIVEGLWMGGEVEGLEQAIAEGVASPSCLRLFVGYSGWGEGQLDGELEIGSWVVAPPAPGLVFDERGQEALWRRALRSLGRDGDGLSRLPPDVSWN